MGETKISEKAWKWLQYDGTCREAMRREMKLHKLCNALTPIAASPTCLRWTLGLRGNLF